MNEAQETWLNYYIESGDDKRAVEVAYPDVSEKNRSSKASKLRAALSVEIDRASREQYAVYAPKMQNVLMDIALNGKQEAVRLKAADTWLSRSGHDAAQVIEVKKTVTHEQLLVRLSIAAQGIDPKLLAGVLPEQIIKDITPKEIIKDERH